MLNTKVNFNNLVEQLLPWHKRQRIRLLFLQGLISALSSLWTLFDAWRTSVRMLVHVTSQVAVLEGYLRKKYDSPVSIKIASYNDGLVPVALLEEDPLGTSRPEVGLPDENVTADVPLEGETREIFGDVDFIVYIPHGLDIDQIRAEIERYRQALVRYKIIQGEPV